MPLAQRVCQSILSGGLGELGPQNGGRGGCPPVAAEQPSNERQECRMPRSASDFCGMDSSDSGGGGESVPTHPRYVGKSPGEVFHRRRDLCTR
jgi:hypothetical protein